MDIYFRDMEIRPIYAGELDRRRRQVFPIRQIGRCARKTDWVHGVFNTFNFSFILDGGGRYTDEFGEHQIEGPAVLIQRPGEMNDYGPTAPWGFWNEVYFIYDARLASALVRSFRLPQRRRHWRIEHPERVRELMNTLGTLTWSEQVPEEVDRIDLTCEALIMESLPRSEGIGDDPLLAKVVTVRNVIETDFSALQDVDLLAKRHGLSRSVFRRLWTEVCPTSPSRYLMDLKLKHACRLLIESTLSVGDIASAVGFSDSLYFSRKFRQNFKITATGYRKKYLRHDAS